MLKSVLKGVILMTDKEIAVNYFSNDIYATETTGITIDEVSPGFARCSMDIERRHLNAGGVVMGGAIFTLADFAFSVVANCRSPLTVSICANINYLSPAVGKKLIAEAKCTKNGKSVCFGEVLITNDEGRLIATMQGSGFRKTEK